MLETCSYYNDLVKANIHKCDGCNKCMRVCPVETANVTFLDRQERIRVRNDSSKCLGCAACISVCHRGARYFEDDTEKFFNDLRDGKRISLLISTAFAGNFHDYKVVFNFLRQMGVHRIYDLSLGMDIYVWAHIRHIENSQAFTMITSHCPVLTSYCKLHRKELLPRLSPILSPYSILAIYLKEKNKNLDDLAYLTPCISSKSEFDPNRENLKYSLTFRKLSEYIKKNYPSGLNPTESDFDHVDKTIGTAVSVGNSFQRKVEFFTKNKIRVDRYSGQRIFKLLDVYSSSDPDDLPHILELINCELGCDFGPAHVQDLNNFKMKKVIHRGNNLAYCEEDIKKYERLHQIFDQELDLNSFYQTFHPCPPSLDFVTEDRVEEAFNALGKRTTAQRTMDCYACGANTCRDMAVRIALGVNIPENCYILAKDNISNANKRYTDYLKLIRVMGEYMLASCMKDKYESIENSMMTLCSAMDASRASIWKTTYDSRERARGDIVLSFPRVKKSRLITIDHKNFPEWLEAMGDDKPVIKSSANMTAKEKKFFREMGYGNLCCVPIMAGGDFWGFLMISRSNQKPFTKEELGVIESAGCLIISTLISIIAEYHDQTDTLGEMA
ncbi:MAG: 4Fe-4S dicluster domain-containing protein [Deltaproteobacteria bacterium]|nr:4Fe-4S dicluster domain-containing protein [Deltaproteobacteria bacterium]